MLFRVCSRVNLVSKRSLYQTSHNVWSTFLPQDTHDWHCKTQPRSDSPILCNMNETNYLIVGGGIMGQALAYNLWRKIEKTTVRKASKDTASTQILLVEKDPTLQDSSTLLSVGGLRTQFSEASNVQLSMLTAKFMREIDQELSTCGDDDLDVQFRPHGYLLLASENGEQQLMKNYDTQTGEGAKIMLFNEKRLKELYPWLNTDGIKLGSLGIENEGWFDPSLFVNLFKRKNASFPVVTVKGEVVGTKREFYDGPTIEDAIHEGQQITGVHIKVADSDKPVFVRANRIINCGGADAAVFARMCGVGAEETQHIPQLQTPLPVERRKRYVYVVHCPDAPVLDMPMVCDPSGVYVRRDGFGGKYVCGKSPDPENEPETEDLEVDHDFFYEEIWPTLAHRIPAFEKLKVTSAWAGYYDYNTFDQNAIIGPHPFLQNLYFMNGFSGHGIQQAYGASLCLSEMLVTGESSSADIKPFSFDRVINQRPFIERNVI